VAYLGEYMNVCTAQLFDFNNTYAVVVSGDGINVCGHMLLNTGGPGGYHFHIAGVHDRPRYMTGSGFNRYVKENGKRVLRRQHVPIKDPKASHRKLEELLAGKWRWLALPNNCANFVEEVVRAGGSKAGLYSNCPAAEGFK